MEAAYAKKRDGSLLIDYADVEGGQQAIGGSGGVGLVLIGSTDPSEVRDLNKLSQSPILEAEHSSIQMLNTATSSPSFIFCPSAKNCYMQALLLLLLTLILYIAVFALHMMIQSSVLQWFDYFLLLSFIFVSGRLLFTHLIFLIQIISLRMSVKALYFVFPLNKSLRSFLSFVSVLLSWFVLIKPHTTGSLGILIIQTTLITSVISPFLSILRIVILSILDCWFYGKNFFQNIQDQIYNATESIPQASLKDQMIKISTACKSPGKLLNTTSQGIEMLDLHLWVIQFYLVPLIWCRLMGILTTRSSLYLLSPIAPICLKICIEGVAVGIVMQWFDKGHHLVIDNEQRVVVQDIGYYSTYFKKDNNETGSFPNVILCTKFVTNLNRSPGLTETVEIHVSSTAAILKPKIEELIRSQPKNWCACCFICGSVDGGGKDMFNIKITNAREFRDFNSKEEQRSNFILELKGLMKNLGFVDAIIK